MSVLYSAVSPNRSLVAIYAQPKGNSSSGNSNSSSLGGKQRLVIKCYDSNVSVGSLKFTLSANIHIDNDNDNNGNGNSNDNNDNALVVEKLHFSSNEILLASCSTPSSHKILVFDLNRGVHSQTIDLAGNTNSTNNAFGDLCAFTAKENLIYALYKKQTKALVAVYDIRKEGKVVAKVKCGSCEDDGSANTNSNVNANSNMRLDIAVHPNADKGWIAVCIGKKLKLIKVADGSSPGKFKIKSNDGRGGGMGGGMGMAGASLLQFTSDGMYIIASTPSGNAAHVFSMKNWSKVGVINVPHQHPHQHQHQHISSIQVHTTPQGRYYAAIVSNSKSKVSLVDIGTASSTNTNSSSNTNNKKNAAMEVFATMTLPPPATAKTNKTIINEAFFAAGNRGGFEMILVELKPRGMNNVDVNMLQVPFKDVESNNNSLLNGDLYPKDQGQDQKEQGVSANGNADVDADIDADVDMGGSSKKRKAPQPSSSSSNVVLGPGEGGGEAMIVTDQTSMKRPKLIIDNTSDTNNNNSDKNNGNDVGTGSGTGVEDDFVLEQGDEAEESIAQRLALLSSELDRDTEDEEELLKIQMNAGANGNAGAGTVTVITNANANADSSSSNVNTNVNTKFMIKNATSDSLTILLQQALAANDDSQLEVALQVSDKRVIENSILGLLSDSSSGVGVGVDTDIDASGEMIIMLLTKLVTRIARKPSRAQRLSFWIRTVLVALLSRAGSSSSSSSPSSTVLMGKTEREIASRLGPLRNMLSERVESLPELLKLEGRLSLLSTKL